VIPSDIGPNWQRYQERSDYIQKYLVSYIEQKDTTQGY